MELLPAHNLRGRDSGPLFLQLSLHDALFKHRQLPDLDWLPCNRLLLVVHSAFHRLASLWREFRDESFIDLDSPELGSRLQLCEHLRLLLVRATKAKAMRSDVCNL